MIEKKDQGAETVTSEAIWRSGLELLARTVKESTIPEPERIGELLIKLLDGTGECHGWADMVKQLRGFGLTVEQAHYVADIYLVVDMTTAGGPLDDYWAPDTVDRIRADLVQKARTPRRPPCPAGPRSRRRPPARAAQRAAS